MPSKPCSKNHNPHHVQQIREKALIADGLLSEATDAAVAYAEAAADTETLNGLLSVQSALATQRQFHINGEISYEEHARALARLSRALLARTDALPDQPTPQASQQRLPESTFKWRIFYLFLVAKVFVVGLVLVIWNVEAFTQAEVLSLINALVPGFVLHASLMYRHLLRTGRTPLDYERFVPRRFWPLALLAHVGYVLLQGGLVWMKATGTLRFEIASPAFLVVETALAQFMGEMVEQVFKTKES
jgi:hypothetical protein